MLLLCVVDSVWSSKFGANQNCLLALISTNVMQALMIIIKIKMIVKYSYVYVAGLCVCDNECNKVINKKSKMLYKISVFVYKCTNECALCSFFQFVDIWC